MTVPYGFWISPSGKMIAVQPGQHTEVAKELLGGPGRGSPMERLTNSGYVRAVFDRKSETLMLEAHVPPHGPLPPMIWRAVKDYAIENHINAVFTTTDREGRCRQRELHTHIGLEM